MTLTLNLTQHQASAEQMAAGVVEPADKQIVSKLLTFDTAPDGAELRRRAEALAAVAVDAGAVGAMVGGAPYLMSALERALKKVGVRPLYAFSERVSLEETQLDGSTKKSTVFRHAGWVEV